MYNLELEKAKDLILKNNPKNVLIQLPDGLKPKSREIKLFLEKETSANILLWSGSCFGACDYPYYIKDMGVDLLIAWGHSEWN